MREKLVFNLLVLTFISAGFIFLNTVFVFTTAILFILFVVELWVVLMTYHKKCIKEREE